MALAHWTVEIDGDGLAWVGLDVAGKSVNVLTRDVLAEMAEVADQLESNTSITGMALFCGKDQGFIYGADINEFSELKSEEDVAGLLDDVHSTFDRFAELPFPTVAGIDGFALGGGLEVPLICDRLIATNQPKTQLAFPEVKLGLLPGYGGTGRAYARVGAANVLDMMLTGRMVSAQEAENMGLVDMLVDTAADLKPTMQSMLAELKGQKPQRHGISDEDTSSLVEEAAGKFTKRLRPDHTPAPFAILDHITDHAPDAKAISNAEKLIFPALMMSRASDGLRRVYQLNDLVKKTARGDSGFQSVHVIGAGVMGGDIAAVAAMSGFQVTLHDMSASAIDGAIDRARSLYERRLKTPEKINAAMDRLVADPDGAGLSNADLIIEAVAERLDIKQKVFSAAEQQAKTEAVLATNTSSIPLEEIASALKDPSRLIGLHFFNPVPVLPLVEVIASRHSDDAAMAKGMSFAGQLKKMPIRCQSSPGFVVNRALLPYINAGVAEMLAGGNPDEIDQALVNYGMPMGPIELADQIGLDVMLDASTPLGMPEDVAKTYQDMIAKGTIGRKSGQGFYEWDDKKAIRPRAVYEAQSQVKLASKLLQPMVKECQAVVDEGVVDSADHADAAMIFGVGFPGFRGGPLHDHARNTN